MVSVNLSRLPLIGVRRLLMNQSGRKSGAPRISQWILGTRPWLAYDDVSAAQTKPPFLFFSFRLSLFFLFCL